MSHSSESNGLRYIIIGAGMAGILAAIKLKQAGKNNICVYEKGDSVGGTWRENTYPGLTCDVPAHSYTYSFAPNPEWTQFFAPGSEIHDYFKGTAKNFGIHDLIRFNKEIESCEFIDGQWHLMTSCGIRDQADVVICATGVLHHPRWPDLKNIDCFEGRLMHSAQWDHSAELEGKRIAVVGTGSTGVQMVSALSGIASQLTHFQRSPQWVIPVENPSYTEEERQAFRDNPELLEELFWNAELDANTERFTQAITDPGSEALQQISDIAQTNLNESIKDPVLREKLRPNYVAACKRLIYSPDFYQAVQRPNVEVVVEGISEIEPKGIRSSDGVLHEFDVIALATGFRADRFMRPMNLIGRNGTRLDDVWKERPSAYMAISIPDFPNLFMLNGPNGPVGNFSLIEIAEHQWGYIEQLIDLLEAKQYNEVSVSHEGMEKFETARVEAAKQTVFATGCSSWYLDASGVPSTWPWTRSKFKEEMQKPKLNVFELI